MNNNGPETLRFYWLRHAPPVNPRGLCYGRDHVAVDLSDTAAFQAQAGRIPDGAAWYITPAARTLETARKIAGHHPDRDKIVFHLSADLVEQDFGDWVGLERDDIKRHPAYPAYKSDPENNAPPGGENLRALFRRVSAEIDRLILLHRDGGAVVLNSHGGPIRCALSQASGIALKDTLNCSVEPLSLSIFAYDRGRAAKGSNPWTVEHLNARPSV